MKQGVNNSRLYTRHRHRTFQDKHRENIQDYYNTHTKGLNDKEGVNMYGWV